MRVRSLCRQSVGYGNCIYRRCEEQARAGGEVGRTKIILYEVRGIDVFDFVVDGRDYKLLVLGAFLRDVISLALRSALVSIVFVCCCLFDLHENQVAV